MIGDFDVDPITGRLVLWCRSISGETWLKITEPSGEIIGEVPPEFLPHHPRWAPDGLRLTFSGNDGRIRVYELSQNDIRVVYEDQSIQAGFSQWSPNGTSLVSFMTCVKRTWSGPTPVLVGTKPAVDIVSEYPLNRRGHTALSRYRQTRHLERKRAKWDTAGRLPLNSRPT